MESSFFGVAHRLGKVMQVSVWEDEKVLRMEGCTTM